MMVIIIWHLVMMLMLCGMQCAKQHGIDYDAVLKCVNGPQGNKLEHEMAVLTDKLKPPHDYTPWMTLNGVRNSHAQSQFILFPFHNFWTLSDLLH